MTLRKALAKQNPAALSRVHVAEGIFLDRTAPDGGAQEQLDDGARTAYEATGGSSWSQPPVGDPARRLGQRPVPRPHSERNWPHAGRIKSPQGIVEDSIPEDMSLYIDTPQGLVVITGCGHAGTINTVQHARSVVREAPAYGLIGGLHLFASATGRWSGPRPASRSSGWRTCSARLHRDRGSLPVAEFAGSTGRPRSSARWDRASASTAGSTHWHWRADAHLPAKSRLGPAEWPRLPAPAFREELIAAIGLEPRTARSGRLRLLTYSHIGHIIPSCPALPRPPTSSMPSPSPAGGTSSTSSRPPSVP